jgi:hypothetical protein
MTLTASAQCPTPVPHDRLTEHAQATAIARHRIVTVVPQQDAPQPGSLLCDGPVHAPLQRVLNVLQLLAQALGDGLAPHRELPLLRLTTGMRKAEEVKRLRFALSSPLPSLSRKAPKLSQSGLPRVQFQMELLESFS